MTRADLLRALDWLLVCVLALMLVGWRPAEAHDIYRDWVQPDTFGSCCNDHDCRPTTAYMDDDGRWHARVRPGPDGFLLVPTNKILKRQPDGRCHICVSPADIVYCFAPCDPRS